MKKFSEYINEKNEMTNLNMGVESSDKSTIAKIEKELDKLGIDYDNEGSNDDVHNINAGFSDRKDAEKFDNKWGKKIDYSELETVTF